MLNFQEVFFVEISVIIIVLGWLVEIIVVAIADAWCINDSISDRCDLRSLDVDD